MLFVGVFIVLFISVWLPCCFSDIIFPMLFVRSSHSHEGHCCCHHHHQSEEAHS
jgi:hypothetical protein